MNLLINKNKSALFIAHKFPPVFGSGTLRIKGFVSNLTDSGWNCRVLTLRKSFLGSSFYNFLTKKSLKVPVERIFALDVQKHLSIRGRYVGFMAYPDRFVLWIIPAVIKGLQIIKTNNINVLFSSFPIPSSHMIGYLLYKITGVPWVADFRDPMVQDDYPKEYLKRLIWQWIERRTVNNAAKVLFTTVSARDYYLARYPSIKKEKFQVLQNGYNEEDFESCEPNSQKHINKIKFVHAGTIYPYERDPRPLFEGIKILLEKPDITAKDFLVEFYGAGDSKTIDMYKSKIKELKIKEDCIRFHSSVPHKRMLQILFSSDILLILQGSSCNYQIPAKVYEYFKIGKPILALTPQSSETGKIIFENNAGIVTPMDIPEKIADSFANIILSFRSLTQLPSISNNRVDQFSRRSQTKHLASIFEKI